MYINTEGLPPTRFAAHLPLRGRLGMCHIGSLPEGAGWPNARLREFIPQDAEL